MSHEERKRTRKELAHRAKDPVRYRTKAIIILRAQGGISYDELCREVTDGYRYGWRGIHAVRAVRWLLFNGIAETRSDESVWLTPVGESLVLVQSASDMDAETFALHTEMRHGNSGKDMNSTFRNKHRWMHYDSVTDHYHAPGSG